MNSTTNVPWHNESYERFLNDYLPALLAQRLPLSGYSVAPDGGTWAISVAIRRNGDSEITTRSVIPGCAPDGTFTIGGVSRVVLPVATARRLDEGEILCVGEQLLKLLEERLPAAPTTMAWDEALLRNWLSLEEHIGGFLGGKLTSDCTRLFGTTTVQELDQRNTLARITHLRRILVPRRSSLPDPTLPLHTQLIDSSERGRTCPFETPEGPMIGQVLSIARGAIIRDRKLVVVDSSPAAGLGLTGACIPCLNHSDVNRLTMGANMMRQWVPLPDPEPAMVQTGLEPNVEGVWCGRNLLTAYMSFGAATYEDAIVISESAARRLSPGNRVEVGDKLSNRHGTKGVISTILPDAQMPHTPDGKAVDIIFSFIAIHTRMNFGQHREALCGLIAQRQGRTIVVPPFGGMNDTELKVALQTAGLPQNGMMDLCDARDGNVYDRPILTGIVYWGLTVHRAAPKLRLHPETSSFVQYQSLRAAGAHETILEQYHTQIASHADVFAVLQQRLAIAGIQAELADGKLHFAPRQPQRNDVRLACALPHPWLPDWRLQFVPAGVDRSILLANAQLQRLLDDRAPASLVDRAQKALEQTIGTCFVDLVTPATLHPYAQSAHTARAVIAPASDLLPDQVGIPGEMAWHLFGEQLASLVGDHAVRTRTQDAGRALDDLMRRSWVLMKREPAVMPTAIIAFHPVRRDGSVVRLHPLCCPMLNADHDGDEVTIYLPISAAAQQEAGEKLSAAGHLRRDPSVIRWLMPRQEALLALAWISRSADGRSRIAAIAGTDCNAGGEFVTIQTMQSAMTKLLAEKGPEATLLICHRLMHLGLEGLRRAALSYDPFAYEAMPKPVNPDPLTFASAQEAQDAVIDQIMARTDYESMQIGPQLLAVKSGARGNPRQLAFGFVQRGIVDAESKLHHFAEATAAGLSPEAFYTSYIGARAGLAESSLNAIPGMRQAYGIAEPAGAEGFGVLARAMRSAKPGPVFARAAAAGEVDPLTDPDSRYFVGLR